MDCEDTNYSDAILMFETLAPYVLETNTKRDKN